MTPNISPSTAALYNTRILHGNPERLTEDDLRSRATLITLCAILESHDAPSASCLGSRKIARYHAEWLAQLPNFPRVGYISAERDFYTGEPCLRLYLLADWLDTQESRARYDARLAERSEAWTLERIRWWRLWHRLMNQFSIGCHAAQAQIEAHHAALVCKYELARSAADSVLRTLGFYDDVRDDVRSSYDEALRAAQSTAQRAYASVTDFTNFPHG